MLNWNTLSAGVAFSALAVAGVQPAYAQVTTSSITGDVQSESGDPIAGASVTVVQTDTGLRRSAVTSGNGSFVIRNLPIGGTYTVTVDGANYQGQSIEDITLNLGDATDLDFNLTADGAGLLDIIVVSANAANRVIVADGPNASFGLEALQNAPAINRNIVDVLRLDPRVYVDESRGDINPVQCGGKNPRFNSLTLDGVRLNDGFGLNSNGYPTERQPFPFDAIEQVAIELAPFDVEYGGFTACNINAVTKSGSNSFSGIAFIDYTSDGLQGGSLEGQEVLSPEFDDVRYGAQLSGPIIRDRLFFSVSYEKQEGVNLFTRGALGSGAINEVNITQAELDEIVRISRDVYQYDPGEIPSSFDNSDEKLLVKLDWNISDQHRAAFTYNYNDGFNVVASDSDQDEIEFSNHLYERGSELNQYVGFLYSDWTDRFSTELRIGYVDLDARVRSLGGTGFGEIIIETDDVDVYIGADDSRQANDLNYSILSMAFKGFYDLDDHALTLGFEREEFDIFNLFVQHTQTQIDFDRNPGVTDPTDLRDPAIVNFERGLADNVDFNNAPSLNPRDAAAEWGYAVNTLYAQDNWRVNSQLSLVLGLRYDFWQTDNAPAENAQFLADYGFSNSETLDGRSLLQPRFAFTYDATDNLLFRGGVGLYAGGDPNVWLSNTYSANNVLQFGAGGGPFGLENGSTPLFGIDYTLCSEGAPVVGPGYCVPQDLADSVAAGAGSNFELNYLDPDFEIPSEWKFALGATWFPDFGGNGLFGGEYVVNVDLLHSRSSNSAIVQRGDLEQTGTTADGYPIFSSNRVASFVLTNSDEGNRATTVSLSVAKEHDSGFNWAFGYAWNDARDVSPMTSSVAFSNYNNRAFFDPQEDIRSVSDYNIRHRFTLLTSYQTAFFGDYLTKITAFGTARSGLPYSIVRNDARSGFFNFTPFINGGTVLAPGFDRNSEEGSWWAKVDLRFEQELPGIGSQHRTSAFIVIDNFTNLLNDDWGILREPGFPPVVQFDRNTGNLTQDPESRVGNASLYQIRLGFQYKF